ncbi:hypothetical protein [Marinoscillum sp. 108]|uniref:hypothetical protein n=1 Tax=Marinoscillum sp. 108 TaxID=2653151 RepID=UPI0012F33CC1|nr:hypothetical protein [Marinoscillum sp. 108]VXD14828.1 conserved exported hypothetical protein [Marinoscillum sp. 108]
MKVLFYSILLACSTSSVIAQQVDVQYLNPKHYSTGVYKFIRIGTSSDYGAGLMLNESSADYGDGNDFSLFTYNDRDLTIKTGLGNFIVFPSSGGNMGVGMTNPISKLDVLENSGSDVVARFRTGEGRISIGAAGPSTANYTYGNYISSHNFDGTSYKDLGLKTAAGPPQFVFTTSGNMAVGISSPGTYRLAIKQSSSNSGYGLRILNAAQNRSAQLWVGTGGAVLDAEGGANLHLRTAGIDRIYIKNNGQIGMGTSATGSHKLAVEGSIGAREIKVESSGWSDFVFEKDYKLRPLEELESYVSEHQHLPEIPSEAEVTAHGINLGEMNAKLLQKIEELTLYLIEQNKEIRAHHEQNKSLEMRIKELEKQVSQIGSH